MKPQVGHIQFLNCLPLYHMLVKNGAVLEMDLFKDTPVELSRKIIAGRLDISPIPAIEYARHADSLMLLPDLTVSSSGRVMSITVVSKVPIQELDGQTVALTNTSATSQVMAKIIFREKYNISPVYFESPPDLPEMFREAEAALLIGDDALRLFPNKGGYYLYDLGELWQELTGEKMVYAVWAVRREYVRKHPEMTAGVFRAFRQSLAMRALRKYQGRSPGGKLFLQNFWRIISGHLNLHLVVIISRGFCVITARQFRLELCQRFRNLSLWMLIN